MVLVGQGGTEEGHDPVPGELVDGPLVAVDLIHQYPEAPVHDLVHFLRVQLLGEGGVAGHIGEEHRHQLALPFQGTAGVQDLDRPDVWGCRTGVGVVEGRGFFGGVSLWPHFLQNFPVAGVILPHLGQRNSRAPPHSIQNSASRVLKMALGALHFPSQEIRLG